MTCEVLSTEAVRAITTAATVMGSIWALAWAARGLFRA